MFIQSSLYTWILKKNVENHPLYKDYTIMPYRFIVVSRNTKTPLVWRDGWSHCLFDEAIQLTDNVVLDPWVNIVKELNYYLTEKPNVPKGIHTSADDENSINMWIKMKM